MHGEADKAGLCWRCPDVKTCLDVSAHDVVALRQRFDDFSAHTQLMKICGTLPDTFLSRILIVLVVYMRDALIFCFGSGPILT